MENLIQFIEFDKTGRGRSLGEESVSVWYNLNGKSKTFGVTFSNDIKSDKGYIKIGKFADQYCFVFTNEGGFTIYGDPDQRKNIVFNSRGFCEMIFENLKTESKGKDRKVFKLKKLTDEVFVIEFEKK
tara:strand:+ start:6068 stop:6451 length:384 start_codon:yes stop_codon:yes gene_type:complete